MEILKPNERQEQKQNYNSGALISISENLLVTWHHVVFLEEKYGASFVKLRVSLGLSSWEIIRPSFSTSALLIPLSQPTSTMGANQD